MRRWDDFFLMLRAARSHVQRFGYGLKPYRDTQRQTVGIVCEQTHEVWQMDVVLIRSQLDRDQDIKDFVFSIDGLRELARVLMQKSSSQIERPEIIKLMREITG